jgi:protein tyrosine/serine phosphatase
MTYTLRAILTFSVLLFSLPSWANLAHPPTDIGNFHKVSNEIYRGARPKKSDLEDLKKSGFKTIVNIENDDESVAREKKWAQELGLRFVNIPLSAYETPQNRAVGRILALLSEKDHQPLFLHCKFGRDRTGLVIGLFRVDVESWAPNESYQEMLDLGFRAHFSKLTDYFTKRTGYAPKTSLLQEAR